MRLGAYFSLFSAGISGGRRGCRGRAGRARPRFVRGHDAGGAEGPKNVRRAEESAAPAIGQCHRFQRGRGLCGLGEGSRSTARVQPAHGLRAGGRPTHGFGEKIT